MTQLHLFPSLVVFNDVEPLVTNEIQEWAKTICFEKGKHSYETRCLSTVNTAANILELEELQPLVQPIQDSISEYISAMKYDTKNVSYYIQSSWLNYYEPLWCQELHTHQNSTISGTLDIIGSDQFDFYLVNPAKFLQPIQPPVTELNDFNQNDARMMCKRGFIKVFHSGMLHGTRQVDCERLTLAFNVAAAPKHE